MTTRKLWRSALLFVVGSFAGLLIISATPSAAVVTKNGTLNISGTASQANPTAQCTVGFTDQCPSGGGNCQCFEIASPKVTGSIKGVTPSALWVTVDKGVNLADSSDPVSYKCNPFYGTITLAGTDSTTTLNLLGTTCRHVNSSGVEDKNLFSGGWGVTAEPAPSPASSGDGTLSGTINKAQVLSLKLTGQVSH